MCEGGDGITKSSRQSFSRKYCNTIISVRHFRNSALVGLFFLVFPCFAVSVLPFRPVSVMKKIQLIPLILNFGDDNFCGTWDRKFYDPGYGVGAHPQDFHKALPRFYQPETEEEFSNHRRNWREIETRDVTPKRRDHKGKEGFQVCVDVHQFAPSEITVKTVDQSVIVEAQHEEKEDPFGYISRHFRRRYILPEEYHAKDVVAMLSSDGVLSVKAPPMSSGMPGMEKEVHIHHTGPAYLNALGVTVNPKERTPNTRNNNNEDTNRIEKDFELLEEAATAGGSCSTTTRAFVE